MTTIYLIRHGQTDWNRDKIFRGRADVPLNDHGRREAEALSAHLNDVRADACYSSPLSRAVETAEITVRLHSLDVRTDDGLIDIDYGTWQGLAEAEVKDKYVEIYTRWRECPQRTKFPGGENLAMVRKRALDSLERIRSAHPDGTVFVASHRVVTKVLMCASLGLGNRAFWRIQQDNCAYNVIELLESGIVVVVMNDTCHMRAAGISPALGDF